MTTATPNLISIINRIDLPKEVNPFLEKAQAAMVFQQTGCWPVIRGRKQWDKKSSHGDRMLTIKSKQKVAPEKMEKARELVMNLLQPLPLPGVKVGSESDWGSWADACAAAALEADDLANAQEEHAADDKLSEVPAEKEDHEASSPGYATKQPLQGLPLIDTRRQLYPPLTDQQKDWRPDHREHDNVPLGFVNKERKPPDASRRPDPEEWFEARKKMLRKRYQEGDPGPPSDAVPVRLPYNVKHWRHVKQKAYSVVAKREEASYPGPPAAADDEHSEVKAEKEDHAAENKLSEVKAKHDCIKTMGLREAWAVPRNDAWEALCKGALDALRQGTMSDDELPFCKEAWDALQQGTMSDDELAEVSAEQTAHPPTPPRKTTQIETPANSLHASSQDRRQPDEPMHSMAQESATLFCCCFFNIFLVSYSFFYLFVSFSNIFSFSFSDYSLVSFIRKLHLHTDLRRERDYLRPVHRMGWGTDHSSPQHLQANCYAKAKCMPKRKKCQQDKPLYQPEKNAQQTKRAAAEQKVEKLPLRVHGEVFATQSRGETFVVAPHT